MQKCNDWLAKDVKVTVVEYGHRPIIKCDLFLLVGFTVTKSIKVLIINQSQCPSKQEIALDFPGLIYRIGKPHKETLYFIKISLQLIRNADENQLISKP